MDGCLGSAALGVYEPVKNLVLETENKDSTWGGASYKVYDTEYA